MWTVIELIRTTESLLRERGSHSPRLDAELLLAHALGGRDRTWLYMNAQRPVSDEERETYRALVGRRARGEPVPYLTGSAGFWSIELAVDSRVLVPRPETERLVALTLEALEVHARDDWRIVDVGTGSGAIALALATELPRSTVLAIDRSPGALEVARDNADRLGLRGRVRFAHGDVLGPLEGREGVVDVVVSNPPYVADDDPDLSPEVRAHEPAMALFAGADGLDVIRRLVPSAARALAPGGLLLVEIGARQGVAALAVARESFAQVRIERDYAGLDRVLVARKAGELAPLRAGPSDEDATSPESAPDDTEAEGETSGDALESEQDRRLAEARAEGLPIIDLDEL